MANYKSKFIIIAIAVLLLGVFSIVLAAVEFNQQINFQGKLTDSSDQAVSNGTKCMQFLLYNHLTATGDALLWSEQWTEGLSTTSGLFSVLLGSNASLSSVNFNQDPIYLEVQYDASCDATYEEVFSPRKRLGAVPAAFEAKQLAGYAWATPDAIGSSTPNTGAFTTLNISGLATFSYAPQGTGIGQGSLYINPSTATADYTLLGVAVGGSQKFRLDADGDLALIGNIAMADDKWLGLGPSAGRIVFDDATTDYIIFSDANVGIGTATPEAKLDIRANLETHYYTAQFLEPDINTFAAKFTYNEQGGDTSYDIILGDPIGETAAGVFRANVWGQIFTAKLADAVDKYAAGYFSDSVSGSEVMLASPLGFAATFMGGNVGIGTTGPDYLLHIKSDNAFLKIESDSGDADLMLDSGAGVDAYINLAEAGTNYWYIYNDGGYGNLVIERAAGTGDVLMRYANVGIGTVGPDAKLDVLDAANPQLRLTNADGSIYTEFKVAPSTGNLTVSLYGASANDIIFNAPDRITGANLWVCKGSSCSELTLNEGGNLVVERGMFLSDPSGNYFQILATNDKELWIFDASGDAVLIFDDATP